MSGWIKLHRKMLKWEWIDSHKHVGLFVNLLLHANYEETKYRGEIILPGQVYTGIKKLQQWTGLSYQNIRTCLNDLKSTNEITIKSNTKRSIITIVNWTLHQQDNNQANKQLTNDQQTTNKQLTTSKKLKKEKKLKNIYIHVLDQITHEEAEGFFNILWSRYPRKVNKKKSKEKFMSLLKNGGRKFISDLDKSFVNYEKDIVKCETEEKYIKHCTTFLNNYEDYLEVMNA